MQARRTAEDELQEQLDNMATPEMKAKYKECREAEAQLASLEQKLGKLFSSVYVLTIELRHEKTFLWAFDEVRHKPACTTTEDG